LPLDGRLDLAASAPQGAGGHAGARAAGAFLGKRFFGRVPHFAAIFLRTRAAATVREVSRHHLVDQRLVVIAPQVEWDVIPGLSVARRFDREVREHAFLQAFSVGRPAFRGLLVSRSPRHPNGS
jgi:hypothetical protein